MRRGFEADGTLRLDFGTRSLCSGEASTSCLRTASGAGADLRLKSGESHISNVPDCTILRRWKRGFRATTENVAPSAASPHERRQSRGALSVAVMELSWLSTLHSIRAKRHDAGRPDLHLDQWGLAHARRTEDVPFSCRGRTFTVKKMRWPWPDALRLHRRILEHSQRASLLTTYYGWTNGDNTPCTYMAPPPPPQADKTR